MYLTHLSQFLKQPNKLKVYKVNSTILSRTNWGNEL